VTIDAKKQFEFDLRPALNLPCGSNERALRLKQVCQLTGLGRSMIYQMQAERRFPQRIKLGERAVGWLEREVQEWLAQRIEISRGKAAAPLSKRAAPVPGFGSRPQ
jgi:prophage regulatory protein